MAREATSRNGGEESEDNASKSDPKGKGKAKVAAGDQEEKQERKAVAGDVAIFKKGRWVNEKDRSEKFTAGPKIRNPKSGDRYTKKKNNQWYEEQELEPSPDNSIDISWSRGRAGYLIGAREDVNHGSVDTPSWFICASV